MLEILIKMADQLDKKGYHAEASKVDALIKKIAEDLIIDFGNGIRSPDDYEEDGPELDEDETSGWG